MKHYPVAKVCSCGKTIRGDFDQHVKDASEGYRALKEAVARKLKP